MDAIYNVGKLLQNNFNLIEKWANTDYKIPNEEFLNLSYQHPQKVIAHTLNYLGVKRTQKVSALENSSCSLIPAYICTK